MFSSLVNGYSKTKNVACRLLGFCAKKNNKKQLKKMLEVNKCLITKVFMYEFCNYNLSLCQQGDSTG